MDRILAVAVSLASMTSVLAVQDSAAQQAPSAVIKTYCVSCHSGRAPAGYLLLDPLAADRPAGDSETWERVVRQLRARTMPPMSASRPDNGTYESTIVGLTGAMDRAAATIGDPLTDTALAVRLAQLIWNSEPDRLLLEAASKGGLRDARTLRTEVRRMLADPKSTALVTGFFSKWLRLDSLDTMKSDAALVPEFDGELRGALRRETELFVESQLREDRSPLDLWTANYTFLNERLARHYGIPNVSGPEYRRVIWTAPERAGLLAQGSILTLTSRPYASYPVDVPTTSPAMRATWVLTRFLGVEPPTPLPNVPPKDFPFEKRTPLVKQSRTFPSTPCLGCHRSFFPLSYGLENFDVIGRWRSTYGRDAIDASGTMVDGTTFTGPVGLRRALVARQDAFLNALTERLMTYAIDGTTAEVRTPAARMPAVRGALREAADQNYSWSALIAAIVKASPDER